MLDTRTRAILRTLADNPQLMEAVKNVLLDSLDAPVLTGNEPVTDETLGKIYRAHETAKRGIIKGLSIISTCKTLKAAQTPQVIR